MFNKFIKSRKIFISLSILVFVASCGKPEITNKCSTNGFGKITCDFQNNGNAKGSKCVKVKYTRNQDIIYEKSFDFQTIESLPVCSGIVEAGDVRERRASGGFRNKNIQLSPSDFCFIDNWQEIYDYSDNYSWHAECTMEIETVN